MAEVDFGIGEDESKWMLGVRTKDSPPATCSQGHGP
jgi:hypothetical protein